MTEQQQNYNPKQYVDQIFGANKTTTTKISCCKFVSSAIPVKNMDLVLFGPSNSKKKGGKVRYLVRFGGYFFLYVCHFVSVNKNVKVFLINKNFQTHK